ncbi:carbohydrate kinase family protein [Nanoarchaeota archaeon]
MFDVITVGSANVDVFACTKYHREKRMGKLVAYPVGEKILLKEIEFTTGGGGTNSAVALARLGLKVGFVGILGNDEYGEIIKKEMKKEKIKDLTQMCHADCTGYSVVLDSIAHDRTIFVFKGANDHLDYNKIKKNKLKTKWFYFSTLLNKSYKTLEKISEFAKKNKIKIMLNASSYLARKGPKFLKKILNNTKILILNLEESKMMVGSGSTEVLLRKLRDLGPEIVIITDGKHGVHVYDGEKIFYGKPHNIKILETTGAGDAFASGFLYGYISKNNISDGIRCGVTEAESVIQHHGAKNKLLRKKEMNSLLKRNPVKITERKV